MWEIILDCFVDTLKVFPFLFLIYVLIELLEHRTTLTQNKKILQGELAPLIGSATGIIPQCGFSVMAAKLYDKGFIRTGTLLAVFIATSDEALIIMLAELSHAGMIMPLICAKLIIAVAVGYFANFVLKREKLADIGMTADIRSLCLCRGHEGKSDLEIYLVSPLLHSLKIAVYLFFVNVVFGCVIEAAGEEAINAAIIGGGPYVQPLITALLGMIPNCASSTILTTTYLKGGILFGSFVGGLCCNAGLGLLVLLKNTKKIKRNLLIMAVLYVVAVISGIVINAIMTVI